MENDSIETSDPTLTTSNYDDSDNSQGCCGPKGKPWRFMGLALMCFLGFGK